MKGIVIIQNKIIMKNVIWCQKSYKTSTQIWKDSREMVASDFKPC